MEIVKLTKLPEVLYGEAACFYSMKTLSGIRNEIELSEVGDKYCIEVMEMNKQEFEKLPEFEGW